MSVLINDNSAKKIDPSLRIFTDVKATITPLIDEMNASPFLREEFLELENNTDMFFEFDTLGKSGAFTTVGAQGDNRVNLHPDYMEISTSMFPAGINLIAIMAHEGIHALEEKSWSVNLSATHAGDTFASTYTFSSPFSSSQTDISNASTFVDFQARSEASATIGQTIVASEIQSAGLATGSYNPSWAAKDTQNDLMSKIKPIEDTIDPENIRTDSRLNTLTSGGLSITVGKATLSYTDYLAYKFGLEESTSPSDAKFSYRATWATEMDPQLDNPTATGNPILPSVQYLVGHHYNVQGLGGLVFNLGVLPGATDKEVAAVVTDFAVGVPNPDINSGRLLMSKAGDKQPNTKAH